MKFVPDYRNLEKAARNLTPERYPLYEHIICTEMMENVLGKRFSHFFSGDFNDKKQFFDNYCEFFKTCGYDTVSFEACIGQIMPGSGSLGGHKEGEIKTREDFEKYPWEEIPDLFFDSYSESFRALREVMPEGMKAVGGPGNGIFECVQDITGYMDLCIMLFEDPDLYADLFRKVGDTNLEIWKRFMSEFSDIYCVMRFGDDLGYKSNTLLKHGDIREHIIPQYKRIIEVVHSYNKPFLIHSCGCIFDVMEDMIEVAKIDAKHSNEDQIAPFPVWVEKYGDRIGNFGGIDTDAVCNLDEKEMREYITDVYSKSINHGGFAFGSGNSIPTYVPVEGYMNMVKIFRELRGE